MATTTNADAYERLLREEIFAGIEARAIAGYRGIQMLRREADEEDDEVEFVTLMWFDSITAVKAFAGEDHTQAVVPPSARALLARFDTHSAHLEVREDRRTP